MIIYHYDDIVPSALVEVYNRNPSDFKRLGFDCFMFSTNPYNDNEIECCKILVGEGFRVLHVISPGENNLNVIQDMAQNIVGKTEIQNGHGIAINSVDIIFSDPKSALAVAKQISRIVFQKFPDGERCWSTRRNMAHSFTRLF